MNHIFFISADTENKIKNNFSVYANTSIAPNGINIPKKYTKKDLKEFLRKQTGKNIDKNDLILITVTNLKFSEKAEGIEILKKTMNQLPKNIWLIILGDGRFLNKVMDNCSNNIIFAGYQKKVYDWLSGSDIFVYCSFLDSLGQVMLEAQAVGLPVVASKIGGISETTKHGSLCKPSPEDFTKALKPLIASKNLRKKQGEQNKCWIKKRSWKNTTKKYITVWNKLSTK